MREQPSYPIAFNKSSQTAPLKGFSEVRNLKPKKGNRTSKRPQLIINGRKRDNKSVGKK